MTRDERLQFARYAAHREDWTMPDDVAAYLADVLTTEREMEGAVIRLIAYASLTGREISLPLAQDVLTVVNADSGEEGAWAELEEPRRTTTPVTPHGGFDDRDAFEHFGWCPECGKTDGFLNLERVHYFYCDAHRTRWRVGSNLFSCWRDEEEETWERNARHLEHYRDVDSHTPTPAMLERDFRKFRA